MPQVKARAQVGGKTLDEQGVFSLRPDLLLEVNGRQIIADTKYKVVYSDPHDPHFGISQPDFYQMVSYAVRYKLKEIYLFYPSTVLKAHPLSQEFVVIDEFSGENIFIRPVQLPIINHELLERGVQEAELRIMFEPLRRSLVERLVHVLYK